MSPSAVPARAARLDRANPLPLWAQLRQDLARRLRDGEFANRFPSDQELTAEYGVSRQTARDAVRRLGVPLDRQRGKGTFVRPAEFEQPVGALYSLFQAIEAQGVEQRSVVLTLDRRVDADIAGRLGTDADAELVFLERLRLAGGVPLALDMVWLPAVIASPLLDADFSHTALYDELDSRCGVRPQRGEERIQPVMPAADEARALGLSPRDAVFAIERRTWAGADALEYRRSLVRGDRYGFISTWDPVETSTALRLVRMT